MLKRLLPVLVPVVRSVRLARQRLAFRREYTPDRHVLEDVIFPAIQARAEVARVLLVGVDWYTLDYPARFPGVEVVSIDYNADKARFGARAHRHVVGSITDADEHFGTATLDAVVMHGVLGWGVDTRDEAERAISACAACLRPGGLLVLSSTDEPHAPPAPFGEMESLRRHFERTVLPPFPGPTYPTFSALGVTFEFYARV